MRDLLVIVALALALAAVCDSCHIVRADPLPCSDEFATPTANRCWLREC